MRKTNDQSKKQAMMEARRARVASFKIQGKSLREMAELLEKDGYVNPRTGKAWSLHILSEDVQELEERWKASALVDITEAKARELAKLDELEREAWAAWHRSYGKRQSTSTERRTGGKTPGDKARVDTEDLAGDPRFLAIVLDCQQRRAKMLGLDAPQKVEASGPNGGPIPVQDDRPPLSALPIDLVRQLRDHMKQHAQEG